MKYLLLTCFLLAVADAQLTVPPSNPITSSDVLRLYNIMVAPFISQCICATGVNPVFVDRFLTKFEFPNDACFKCFLKCLATSLSITHPDGSMYVETVLKIIPSANATMNTQCDNQSKDNLDLCERIWLYGQCYASFVGLA
ncbi:hypothetical protein RN001_015105 [Aquatica leii]|uniref:Uncharacterized protein n=1 Tax=Aquatica leii TaxID=1421715 RepID=A0AAN7S6I0_9COLE|nr:hypothetical protein RN001_015105 [Aquatica leii]